MYALNSLQEDINEEPAPRMFWPREVWGKYATTLDTLKRPDKSEDAVSCLNELVWCVWCVYGVCMVCTLCCAGCLLHTCHHAPHLPTIHMCTRLQCIIHPTLAYMSIHRFVMHYDMSPTASSTVPC